MMHLFTVFLHTLLLVPSHPVAMSAPTQPAIVSAPLVAAPATPAPTTTPAPATGSPTTSASATLDQVQKFYERIPRVTAQFRQQVTNDMYGTTKTSDGTVWILKPGKMRWDYLEKKKDK